ncbi:hypothetical protein CRG98_000179 [Punica granatum]|uniref:Methyltransferase type 11 domain-containing protein n=1 Tax=Punica granatum TaxID=22663 RepID=A0A2I0LFH3_PUNGR|nr:hypothetical protein CRG98_000179 [Punica granatum]
MAELYLDARPNYPKEWFSLLAARTLHHSLAWDVGTGNGQAAVSVAEHYDQVIGTDISENQLKYAIAHPRVRYLHTPLSLPEDDLITQIGGENSVDLITVAHAVHWFDLPSFYATAARALRKPGGVIAVWCYNDIKVDATFDSVTKKFHDTTLPYWNPKVRYVFDGYKTLPFPFENVGLGSEGEPFNLDIPKELSLEGFLRMLRSWSAVVTAKEQGVDLLPESMVKEFETAWGGRSLVRSVVYKAFMLAGKVKL